MAAVVVDNAGTVLWSDEDTLAFVVNENLMIVADKDGKAPPDNVEYQAYCSDGMSDRAFPYSIFLMVDGKPFVGCCSTDSNTFKEPH